MNREFQIPTLAVVLLVMLRIAIGWHFLHEGIWKAEQPEFSAQGYLRQARGPLANWYRGLIPDVYGERRLDVERMHDDWGQLVTQASRHFQYSDSQRKAASNALAARCATLDDLLREEKKDDFDLPVKENGKSVRVYKKAISEYFNALAAWKEKDKGPEVRQIPFEQKRHADKLTKFQADSSVWLASVGEIENSLRGDLREIALPEQREAFGELNAAPMRQTDLPRWLRWLDLKWLEVLTTYSLIAIGLCLMLGFVTRLAAVGGVVFLITAVVLPQLQFGQAYPPPPPSAGHTFLITKEVIEALALAFIALTAVGRWAGLDYIGYALFHRYYDSVGGFVKRVIGKAVGTILHLWLKIRRKNQTHEPVS